MRMFLYKSKSLRNKNQNISEFEMMGSESNLVTPYLHLFTKCELNSFKNVYGT